MTNELIGMVIRNFSGGNKALLEWINGIIEENTGVRRSVRVSFIPNPSPTSALTVFTVGGSWEVDPDRLHLWCAQLPPAWVGKEPAEA